MAQPQPGKLDRQGAGAGVARLADALLARALAAVERRPDQPEIGPDLAPVLEVAPEHLVDQRLAADRADALQGEQMIDLSGPTAGRRCGTLRLHLALDLGELLADPHQTGVLSLDLAHQLGRQGAAVAGASLGKLLEEALAARLQVAHPLAVQQTLDAV